MYLDFVLSIYFFYVFYFVVHNFWLIFYKHKLNPELSTALCCRSNTLIFDASLDLLFILPAVMWDIGGVLSVLFIAILLTNGVYRFISVNMYSYKEVKEYFKESNN